MSTSPSSQRANADTAVWSDDGLLDQIDIAIYAVDHEGRCRRFNAAAERLFGYTQAEALGQNLHTLLHSKLADGTPYPQENCELLRVTRSGESRSGMREVMWSRDGEMLPVECTVVRIAIHGVAGALVTAKDLRPQRKMEETLRTVQDETAEVLRQRDAASRVERELVAAETQRQRDLTARIEQAATLKLREQQELLNHILDASPVGIAVLDQALRFRWHNRAYRELLQRSGAGTPEDGASFFTVLNETLALRAVIEEVRRTGQTQVGLSFPYDAPGAGRSYWNFSISCLPDRELLVMVQNVTEQTLSQQALVQSDKMAAVGRLAASISHEINNPLEAVTNLLYLIDGDQELSETSREYVSMAETEIARVSRIASQTLRFHRHAPEAVTRTPQQLVEPVLALYEGRLKHAHVEVACDFDAAAPLTTFEGDVRQILNNLIGNAIDAMDRGGKLRVRTRNAHCMRTGRPGTRITVTDSGHGMSPETVAHIFEPFYTTKGAAGSGLGLWISHTLAERHGGKLQVKSCRMGNGMGKEPGTTFSLFLPNQEAAAAATIQ